LQEFGEKEIGYTGKTVSTFIPGWLKALKKYGARASIEDLQEVIDSLQELVRYDGKCCYYPVHKAATIGAVKFMDLILSTSYDLNARTDAGRTAFHYACENGRTETVELLIKSSKNVIIDLNATNLMGWTALHFACQNGKTETVELMIKSSKNFKIALNATIISSADIYHHLENHRGCTALHLACINGQTETVELMIKLSKDFTLTWMPEITRDILHCIGFAILAAAAAE